jgi:hypothetical protein
LKTTLKKEQLKEWSESPVTLELKDLVKQQVEEIKLSKADAFHPFDPQRTQETMAQLDGAQDTWEILVQILEGDFSYFMEEDSESVRDNPEGK